MEGGGQGRCLFDWILPPASASALFQKVCLVVSACMVPEQKYSTSL